MDVSGSKSPKWIHVDISVPFRYHIKRYFDYTPSWGSVDMSVVLGCPSKNQSTSSWDYFTGFRALFERLVSNFS